MILFVTGHSMDPNDLLASVSALTEAYRTFPQPVFKLWLDFRRESAKKMLPPNSGGCSKHRVMMLDAAARVAARFN